MHRLKALPFFFVIASMAASLSFPHTGWAWAAFVAGGPNSGAFQPSQSSGNFSQSAPQPDQPENILARAIRLHQAGDFSGAIHEYQAYLAARPRNVEARSNLGAALAHLGRFEQAIDQYQQSLALNPEGPRAPGVRFNLAVAYYKSGQISAAATEFHRLLDSKTAAPQAVINATTLLADCHLRLGENKKVIELLVPLENARRDDLAVAYLLGMALIRDNQLDRGQVMIARVLRNGDSAQAWLLMGTVKLMGNDVSGGLKDLERAAQLDPNLPSVHSLYGRALMDVAGNPEGAVKAFRQELAINPNDFDANFYLGALLKRDKSYDEAVPYLNHALEVRPGDLGARYQLAMIHLELGRVPDARQELEALTREAPKFIEAHVSLAATYYRLKLREDGDRERELLRQLNAEIQSRQVGVQNRAEGQGESVPQPQ